MNSLVSIARIRLKTVLKVALSVPGLLFGVLRRHPPGLRVLFYHRVNPYPFDQLGPVSRETTVGVEAFGRQLEYLRGRGFRTVKPDELLAMLAGRVRMDERAVAITFDDGYEDNLLYAAPLLQAHGFSAMVFVITDFMGKESGAVWSEGDLPGFGRFLSQDQLRALPDAALCAGSHSVSHRLLSHLDEAELAFEARQSRQTLEAATGSTISLFAYPGGDFDARAQAASVQAGYAASFTTIPGLNHASTPLHALRRTEVSASDTLFVFRMKLAGALDWLWFKESAAFRKTINLTNRWLIRAATRR